MLCISVPQRTGESPGAPEHITAVKAAWGVVNTVVRERYVRRGEVWGWEVSLLGDDRGDGSGVPAEAAIEAEECYREVTICFLVGSATP